MKTRGFILLSLLLFGPRLHSDVAQHAGPAQRVASQPPLLSETEPDIMAITEAIMRYSGQCGEANQKEFTKALKVTTDGTMDLDWLGRFNSEDGPLNFFEMGINTFAMRIVEQYSHVRDIPRFVRSKKNHRLDIGVEIMGPALRNFESFGIATIGDDSRSYEVVLTKSFKTPNKVPESPLLVQIQFTYDGTSWRASL